jgi:hypothetical protein
MAKGTTTSAVIPETCAAGPFARLVKQTERAIQGRARDGRLPRAENGEIDLARVVLLGMHAAAEDSRGETSGADLDRNKARESLLRGDRLELLNAQLRADLIPAEEMEAVVGAAFDAARVKLLAIPVSLAPRVAAMGSAVEVTEALTKALHDALGDLSDGEIIATVKERARSLARRPDGDAAAGTEDGAAA